jgi:hypothetical protein
MHGANKHKKSRSVEFRDLPRVMLVSVVMWVVDMEKTTLLCLGNNPKTKRISTEYICKEPPIIRICIIQTILTTKNGHHWP